MLGASFCSAFAHVQCKWRFSWTKDTVLFGIRNHTAIYPPPMAPASLKKEKIH